MLKESNLSLQRNWQTLIKPEALDVEFGIRCGASGDHCRRAAGTRLRHDAGQLAAAILLSSLQGAAVTAVRIDGVLHEFSTISGVREDVTDIVLNIKQLARAHAWRGAEADGAHRDRPWRSEGRRRSSPAMISKS